MCSSDLAAGEIAVADEIHTPDSSRYWIRDSYEDRHARGEEPDGYAVSPKDLYATVLHALGADTEASLTTPDGRPIRVVDEDAEPVQRILA